MKDLSLYIHIPFCQSKCYYCDFISFPNINEKIDIYIDSLLVELRMYKEKAKNYEIKTIFIGGGTPTFIDSKHISKIMKFIYNNYNLSNDIEITIEGNPGTLNKEKVKKYKELGINRFSLGLQTLNDNLLEKIGRSHRSKDFYDSYNIFKEMGIDNINVDLIFGLPDQKIKDILETIDKVLELGIKHISYYGLILEEGTPLYSMYKEGKLSLPDEDKERDMYHIGRERLKEEGYLHYEISNFGLKNYECKHNLVYWDVKPYIGLGLSSHSCFNGKRFWNTENMEVYIDKLKRKILPIEGEEIISKETEISEFCILGLRKIKGINKVEFKERFDIEIEKIYGDIIKKHCKNRLITSRDDFIRLTTKGLDLSNLVEVDFLI